MRLLYLRYPISQEPSHQLSWSNFVELLKIEDNLEQKFYEIQSISKKWSVLQLKRLKNTALQGNIKQKSPAKRSLFIKLFT
jgi:predicted nuclease of restriction endonuclease-like (RecB) superfamily